MNYVELSIKKLKDDCTEWAKEINSDYSPDLIIYIAKAGYLIGRAIQEVTGSKLIGIDATRSANKLKETLEPILSHIPKFILNFARKIELKSHVHNNNTERNVCFHASVNAVNPDDIKRILIVDDAIDTGNSVKAVRETVKKRFPSAQIKIAAINVWEMNDLVAAADYFLYTNTALRTPMSKDSKEHTLFKKIYAAETKNGYI